MNYFTVCCTYSDFSMDSSCHGESGSLAHHSAEMSVFGNPLQEPELLGSVTHNQEVNGSSTSLQIRSSARVSKKMRLDSTATPVASLVPDKKGVFLIFFIILQYKPVDRLRLCGTVLHLKPLISSLSYTFDS